MQKRFVFIGLLLAAIIGIGLVVWFVLRPVLPSLPGTKTQQPAPLPAEVPFNPQNSAPKAPTTTATNVNPNSPEEQERQAEEALKRQATDFAARQGTYSSVNNYESLRAITANVTADLAVKLNQRLNQLRKDHPSFGPSWAQSIRPLSTDLDSASLPVIGHTTAKLTVKAQQITETGGAQTTATVMLTVQLTKQGDAWTPSDVSLQPYNP
ncbi:MAG TPA: hypothetical protein VMU11_04305 [Verrucomicrobiae bacterium]|nr:hypothetical protein [Verrucomicrobiae bacterium]